jgi:DNA-binding CsgD family transcriptional regulator
MPRGRPKYPDILTPREWEVLALIREGLTNAQIAGRLGISENGAKYHVLEILSKLGVSSRLEAAAWNREPVGASSRYAGLAALFGLRPSKLGSFFSVKAATVAVLIGVFGFLGALAAGVLVMDQRASGSVVQPEATSEPLAQLPQLTVTVSPTITEVPTGTPQPTAETPSGLVPPPWVQTQTPSLTPAPPGPQQPAGFTELPSSAHAALSAFALSQDTSYAAGCSASVQAGQLCSFSFAESPSATGQSGIQVQLRVSGQPLAYDVVLAPDGSGGYQVVAASGPHSFTIPPP